MRGDDPLYSTVPMHAWAVAHACMGDSIGGKPCNSVGTVLEGVVPSHSRETFQILDGR